MDRSTESSFTHFFHFTLGPVQGFVAQARRTRDFWAGSFLLSWLSAIAMIEVEKQGGEIQFPTMDGAYKSAVTTDSKNGPAQGGVPNRFKAKVKPDFKPEDVVEAVQRAWQTLAETVWQKDVAKTADQLGKSPRYKRPHRRTTGFEVPDSKRVWDLQVDSFWEMNWVLIDCADEDQGAVDRRKNWRTHFPPPQSGYKCSLMAGWRELSGAWDKKYLEDFWKELSKSLRTLDLREDEYLCAPAFIKRRFHRHFHTLQPVEMPAPGWKAHGWRIVDTVQSVPSVSFMAAIPWLLQALPVADPQALGQLAKVGAELAGSGEYKTRIHGLQQILQDRPDIPASLLELDGAIYFPDLYDSHFDKQPEPKGMAVRAALKNLGCGLASPFYAVLLMDGDSLGKLLGDQEREKAVTQALHQFCAGVPELVRLHNGFLIYAGGDDVLALLPLDTALDCAYRIRTLYVACFRTQISGHSSPDFREAFGKASISAAIQFVHVHCPLTRILHDAHALLDDVAKDGCGRDAVAVSVVKTGGEVLCWAQPWRVAVTEAGEWQLNRLASLLKSASGENTHTFSSKFLYGLRDLFARYATSLGGGTSDKNSSLILSKKDLLTLVWAEYQGSGLCPSDEGLRQQARRDLDDLLEQCLPRKNGLESTSADLPTPGAEAALLIRFLASKGANV